MASNRLSNNKVTDMAMAPNFKKVSSRVLALSFLSASFLILGACSGDGFTGAGTSESTTDGGASTPTVGAQTGVPYRIVLSYPIKDSIENLGGGVYRRIGKAKVTDANGNNVADGTNIYLNIIDSVKAEGTVDAITAGASTMTNTTPKLGDGSAITGFELAYVLRNDSSWSIGEGQNDSMFLIPAEESDKYRTVTAASGTQLTVDSAFVNSYPLAPYSGAYTPSYVVGASLLGADIAGEDAAGVLTSGTAATVDGIATFKVTYPATVDTILTGCIDPLDDTRSLPEGSARTYVIARVDGAASVTTVDRRFCFASIAGWTLTPRPTTLTGSGTVALTLQDGGDTVLLPFVDVAADVTALKGTLTVTVGASAQTDRDGVVTFNVVVGGAPATDDTATITFSTGDAVATVTIKIP